MIITKVVYMYKDFLLYIALLISKKLAKAKKMLSYPIRSIMNRDLSKQFWYPLDGTKNSNF